MTQPLYLIYAQKSILDQFDTLEKEGRHPQLGIYKSKGWEQLFLYSYDSTSFLEKTSQFFAKVAYYALSYFGKVELNQNKTSDQRKTVESSFQKECLKIASHSTEASIQELNQQEGQLKASKAELSNSIQILTQQEEDLKSKKRSTESSLQTLQAEYSEKTKVIEKGTKILQQIKNFEQELERTETDIRNTALRKTSLLEELKKLELRKETLNKEIQGLLPQSQAENLKQIQILEAKRDQHKISLIQTLPNLVLQEFDKDFSKMPIEIRKCFFPQNMGIPPEYVCQQLRRLITGAVPSAVNELLKLEKYYDI